MINLAIDIGNSRTKIALFENTVLITARSFATGAASFAAGAEAGSIEIEAGATAIESGAAAIESRAAENATGAINAVTGLKEIIEKHKPDKAILSSVAAPAPELVGYLEQHTKLHHFPGNLSLPLINNYRTPATLGADRLAAAIGAGTYEENTDQLVIIAGTCLTYNFINSRNEFLGGAISPGLHMRLQAMHTFTDKLPLITVDKEFDEFLGTDTRRSLLAGAQTGSLAEMEHMIGLYLEQYPGLRVFLCGGDAEFFDKRLKNSIFAHRVVLDREIILKGLDRALNYQYK